MNTDFRLSIGLFTHPKFIKLRRKLGAEGALSYITLLSFVAQNSPEGDLGGMDAEEIAIASQYEGDPEDYIAALVAVRLLDAPENPGDPYHVHDWAEHNPYAASAPSRSSKAKIAAEKRWGNAESNASNATQAPEQSPKPDQAMLNDARSNAKTKSSIAKTVSSNAPSPYPSPSPDPLPDPSPLGETRDAVTESEPTVSPSAPTKKSSEKKSRIPEDFTPPEEALAWSTERYPGFAPSLVETLTEEFRDHFIANGELKINWVAAWRNWIRRADVYRGGTGSRAPVPAPSEPPPVSGASAALATGDGGQQARSGRPSATPEEYFAKGTLPHDHNGVRIGVSGGKTYHPVGGWPCVDGNFYPLGWRPGQPAGALPPAAKRAPSGFTALREASRESSRETAPETALETSEEVLR
ncbi:MAG: hypothetical protein V4671_28235 [Armatimonadota bacterium]